MIYLATPYTNYPAGIEAAYVFACEQAALLMRAGIPTYSPIAHMHGIGIHGRVDPKDHQFWLTADEPMMAVCDSIVVCKGESWEQSRGIAREIKTFTEMGKLVFYMEPGKLPAFGPLTYYGRRQS